jgi:hypothetical protein
MRARGKEKERERERERGGKKRKKNRRGTNHTEGSTDPHWRIKQFINGSYDPEAISSDAIILVARYDAD